MTSAITMRRCSQHFGRGDGLVRAVDEIDLDVTVGESVVITGPSGCGKSTLLQLMGGLDRPSSGEVELAGHRLDLASERSRAHWRRHLIGFVFQDFHLLEELTAAENVELPALLAGSRSRAARARAADLLDRVGLSDRTHHLPSALSGGQRQRFAIARALVNRPAVLLADEPTGSLDSVSTTEVLRLFAELHESGQTMVMVTHDARTAAVGGRMITMRDGAFVDDYVLTASNASAAELVTGSGSGSGSGER
jgi:putative ABC transport system ATP-binding protein